MAVGDGGDYSTDFGKGTLAARGVGVKPEKVNLPLYILRGGEGFPMTKGEALLLRTKNLIEQNPPKKGKESE